MDHASEARRLVTLEAKAGGQTQLIVLSVIRIFDQIVKYSVVACFCATNLQGIIFFFNRTLLGFLFLAITLIDIVIGALAKQIDVFAKAIS